MLAIYGLHSGTGYSKYLEREGIEQSYWDGVGSRLLGLVGEVKGVQFDAVVVGMDPYSGERLRSGNRTTMTQLDKSGERYIIARQRGVYDMVLSAPKSLSVLSMVDARLIEAHRESVREIRNDIESIAMTRVRRGHQMKDRATANMVQGIWQHYYSRRLNPQIHTHLTTINLTYDATEERWKALAPMRIYENQKSLTKNYRILLARWVERIGYSIERDPVSMRPEIGGVNPQILERFSERSLDRDSAKEDFQSRMGRPPTTREVNHMVRFWRPDKEYLPLPVIRATQLARLTPSERTDLLRIRDQALENSEHIQKSNRLRIHIGSDAYDEGPEVKRWSYGQRISL